MCIRDSPQVVAEHCVQRVWCIAVHVDQSLEGGLIVGSGGDHPVDRPIGVTTAMVFIEVLHKILSQRLAQ